MAVDADVARRLFTLDEYHRMGEAGILGPAERVELIDGEIVQMASSGPRHIGCVINATRLFIVLFGDRAVVSPQNPVVVPPSSEPQPDLLVLRPRAVSYSRRASDCSRRVARRGGGGHDHPVRPNRQVAPLRARRHRGA